MENVEQIRRYKGLWLHTNIKEVKLLKSATIEFSMLTEDGRPKALDKKQSKKLRHLLNEDGKTLIFTMIE